MPNQENVRQYKSATRPHAPENQGPDDRNNDMKNAPESADTLRNEHNGLSRARAVGNCEAHDRKISTQIGI